MHADGLLPLDAVRLEAAPMSGITYKGYVIDGSRATRIRWRRTSADERKENPGARRAALGDRRSTTRPMRFTARDAPSSFQKSGSMPGLS